MGRVNNLSSTQNSLPTGQPCRIPSQPSPPVSQTQPGKSAISSRLKILWQATLLAIGIFAVLIAYGVFRTGSLGAGLAYLRGASIYTKTSVTFSGNGPETQSLVFFNISGRPVKIDGCNTGCSCLAVSGLPAEIPPWQRQRITLTADSALNKDVKVVFFIETSDCTLSPVVIRVVPRGPSRASQIF